MTSDIDGYSVKTTVHGLGPIVYTDAVREADGSRRTDIDRGDPVVLPPELTQQQSNELGLVVLAHIAREYILPALKKRGWPTSQHDFLTSPQVKNQMERALVIVPASGPPRVVINKEVSVSSVPENCGYVLVWAEGNQWMIDADWTPVLPSPIQVRLDGRADELARAVLDGDEEKAGALARLWFPATGLNEPAAIREQLHKEIYVLLFRCKGISEETSNGLTILSKLWEGFPNAVEQLKSDYDLDKIAKEAEEFPSGERDRFARAMEELNSTMSTHGLTDLEVRVIRLETALSVRGEKWPTSDKAQRLGMTVGSYSQRLHTARRKLSDPSELPYRRLLNQVLDDNV